MSLAVDDCHSDIVYNRLALVYAVNSVIFLCSLVFQGRPDLTNNLFYSQEGRDAKTPTKLKNLYKENELSFVKLEKFLQYR